ncbi:MAG: hypothetical protein KKA54_20070, partial [Proteobacteria bacterium]|nr:hypothetical protein [Pseudomonadota bacterium]
AELKSTSEQFCLGRRGSDFRCYVNNFFRLFDFFYTSRALCCETLNSSLILHAPIINPGRKSFEKPSQPQSEKKSTKLVIEVDGSMSTAKFGDDRVDNYNRASIFVYAKESETGSGISTLAPKGHIGHANSVISFPPGWQLYIKQTPGGGCGLLKPTHMYNDGRGGYTIDVMTFAKKGPCRWLKGEYRFQLLINVSEYHGGAMGKIIIE